MRGRRRPCRAGSRPPNDGQSHPGHDRTDRPRRERSAVSHPGLVNGALFWHNWITTDAVWAEFWLDRQSRAVRGKLAEAVVRDAYARMADRRHVTDLYINQTTLLCITYCTIVGVRKVKPEHRSAELSDRSALRQRHRRLVAAPGFALPTS
ncbi:MAG: hypothetical protein OXI33_17825 [Chloroflexota bacterium]|nr:hypothetical protein [Chloroflexota bacterium]